MSSNPTSSTPAKGKKSVKIQHPNSSSSSSSNTVTSVMPYFGSESIKVITESLGYSHKDLHEDVYTALAEDVTYRVKEMTQESMKYLRHRKRTRLSCEDYDNTLKSRNVEPVYGFNTKEFIPFRWASGGGREIHFTEDKELDLEEMINGPLPKVPIDVTVKAHWLCIEGVQPAVPENPPPVPKDKQRELTTSSTKRPTNEPGSSKSADKIGLKNAPHKHPSLTRMKSSSEHELSVEQQLYYKEITEACVGSHESKRAEALQSLATDPGLFQMVPRFSSFIAEGVRINVVQNNLALLIYLMRMVKALLDNPTIYLEKYLHEMVPAVLTCIVSKQLCLRPDSDNHWALRDFAARLMAQICRNFSSTINNLQARITKTFSEALQKERHPLSSHYGALSGLAELGHDVMKVFVMPYVRSISDRLQQTQEGPITNNIDKVAADHLKSLILKHIGGHLKIARQPPDEISLFTEEFGFLGSFLCAQVKQLRAKESVTAGSQSVTAGSQSVTLLTRPLFTQTGMRPTIRPSSSVVGQAGPRFTVNTSNNQKVYMVPTTPTSCTPAQTATAIVKVLAGGLASTSMGSPAPAPKTVIIPPSNIPPKL